jgi:hypothetical protein
MAMASSVTTNLFRAKLADWVLEQLSDAEARFGDGGHNPETRDVISADPDQTDINNPLIVNPIASVEILDDYDLKVTARLDRADLVDVEVSEAGVFTADGELISIRNFGPKIKEPDEIYDVDFLIHF